MGEEVDWDNMPIDLIDLSDRSKIIVEIFNSLQDRIDYFNGKYIGKDLSALPIFFDVYDISEKTQTLSLLRVCENTYRDLVNDKSKQQQVKDARK